MVQFEPLKPLNSSPFGPSRFVHDRPLSYSRTVHFRLNLISGDVKGDEVKRELTKINNLNEKNKLNNLNNTFQQISKLLTNLEAKNQLVMKGIVFKVSGTALNAMN